MHLIDEDPGSHPRALIHDPLRLRDVDAENAQPADIAVVEDRADDGKKTIEPEREVASAVLPDDLRRLPARVRLGPAFRITIAQGLVLASISRM